MNKKTKMWLGVGVVAAAAYYFWNKSKTASFANQTGMTKVVSKPYGDKTVTIYTQDLGGSFLTDSTSKKKSK
jgi:hypothetical protein